MSNMPRIQVLEKAVAELIAAGEVIERPSSIVKELIENAVDAGASTITVEIRAGGIGYIRVSDNGCGIEREDLPLAFLRHATSKVRSESDLHAIHTLGFRGEALASIAAMSRVEITSKTADAVEGATFRIEGGEPGGSVPAGCPTGTSIVIRDVFYNTPARMKFLKKDVSEGNSVAQAVEKCALAHPEIAFRLIRDSAQKLRTTGSGDLRAVVRAVYGRELADAMIPVDYLYNGAIGVTGLIARPAGSKASRIYQNFFVNGRYIRSRAVSAALEEAFKNKLMSGRFPACVLNLTLSAETVDINVHPAKIEVRFAEEKPVFQAVYFAVKSALAAEEPPLGMPAGVLEAPPQRRQEEINAITMHLDPEPAEQQEMSVQDAERISAIYSAYSSSPSAPMPLHAPSLDIEVDRPSPVLPASLSQKNMTKGRQLEETGTNAAQTATILMEAPPQPVPPSGGWRLIGEVFATYILLQQGDDLVLVDKHAAHERILYEQLRENLSYGNRQLLLAPKALHFAREDCEALLENLSRVEALGFAIEDFGDGTVLVRETPIELQESDVALILGEIAARIRAGNRDLTPERLDRLYYSIACRAAVKAGDRSSADELADLVERLRKNPEITHCPHGRPVARRISKQELEKMFGRIV